MPTEIIKAQDEDLGLGAKVIQENHARFVNRDGSLNVHKKGSLARGTFSLYHAILNTSWPRFYAGVLSFYLVVNSLFSALYTTAGAQAFPELIDLNFAGRFEKLFFYSIQVLTTLGSSPLHPENAWANILLAVEAIVGILSFSLGAGLIFARFSNPSVKISFSNNAIVAPYRDGKGFMFRIINDRNTELVEVAAEVTLASAGSDGKKKFHRLKLERDSVSSFPLNWTVVHPINETSPIAGMGVSDMAKAEAEFMITITATDTSLSKKVYTRSSYVPDEIVFNVRFKNILEHDDSGRIVVDPKRIHEIEKV